MSLPPIVYQGSVKDIRGEQQEDHLIFEYSDRYSIFDWGEMPDHLQDKGRALSFMADALFSLVNKPHHGECLVDESLSAVELMNPSRFYKVKRVDVFRPEARQVDGKLSWDYSSYQGSPTDALVPLEVIFRFGIPTGSSILKRAKDKSYLSQLGVQEDLKEGDIFDNPIIEYSTKLESSDTYISYQRAQEIAHLSKEEFDRLHATAVQSALRLKEIFSSIGVILWDGKFEFAFCHSKDGSALGRDFMLVDSIGPDELRLTYQGVQLSKENLRTFYRGSTWHQAVDKAKELAKERGVVDWKKICIEELGESPARLNKDQLEGASMIYKSLANEIAKKYFSGEVFPAAWSMDQLIETFRTPRQ